MMSLNLKMCMAVHLPSTVYEGNPFIMQTHIFIFISYDTHAVNTANKT